MMTPEQAHALLMLIADLAKIIYTPPAAEPEPEVNGQATTTVFEAARD